MLNVIFALIALYFAVIAVLVTLFAFPAIRQKVWQRADVALQAGVTRAASGGHRLLTDLVAMAGGARRFCSTRMRQARRNRRLVFAALTVLLAPSLFVFLGHRPALFDFQGFERAPDQQIETLLNGEQLVPPPPLPPEMFATREVELVKPDIVHASRNWDLLKPDFRQRLLVVFKLMRERHGYDMVLIEGYRSPERQAQLFAQGQQVTQAGANMSFHQYGLAADVAFLRDGKIVISESDAWAMSGYELYGEVAEQVGLTWGGRWKMRDFGHAELRRGGVLGS